MSDAAESSPHRLWAERSARATAPRSSTTQELKRRANSSAVECLQGVNVRRRCNRSLHLSQPVAQNARGAIAVPCQPRNLWPQPGPQNREPRKAPLQNPTVGVHKTIRPRKAEIEFIRNYFYHPESSSSSLCSARHCSRLHVNRLRSKRISQPRLLLRARDRSEADQYALALIEVHTAAVARIDNPPRMHYVPHFQLSVERSGKAHRINDRGRVDSDHRLRRSPRCLRSNSSTNQHEVIFLEKAKAPAAYLLLDDAPLPNQRTHLALQRGHNGDSRHIRCLGTTPPPAAMPLRPARSSSPVRVAPCRNWQTSFSFPCEPCPQWREARGATYAR